MRKLYIDLNKILSRILLIMISLNFVTDTYYCKNVWASAGTIYESEPNNTAAQADYTHDDYDNYGKVSYSTDVDWWKVSFTQSGNANFWLGNIPSGCNYDIYLYNCDKTSLLASSKKTGNQSELFSYPVIPGVTYYVKIESVLGNSSSYYLFRTKNYPEVVLNRQYTTYSETIPYETELKEKMNCYGYALQVYSEEGDEINPYAQFPGEFANDGHPFDTLYQEHMLARTLTDGDDYLDFIEEKMEADFSTLYGSPYNEWVIIPSSATESVPDGVRKIALTVDCGHDYHFYVRHTDGTWSHKRGNAMRSNVSIDTHVQITDANIQDVISEGGYDDGARYYLISKSFIPDYRHGDGHSDIAYTPWYYRDRAGNSIYKAEKITRGRTKSGKFDYSTDLDYFEFIPTVSRNYIVTTSLTSSDYDVDIIIFDHTGNILTQDISVGNPNISIDLTAGEKYYVRMRDARQSTATYKLYFN